MKKQILPTSMAPAAMPPKPKTAAMSASTKKLTVQLSTGCLRGVISGASAACLSPPSLLVVSGIPLIDDCLISWTPLHGSGAAAAPQPLERRGQSPNLEVEISYAAGIAASAAAVAWFLYGYCRETGFPTIGQLLVCVTFFSVIEVFAALLSLYLLYRGVWMAARLLARNAPERWAEDDEEGARFREDLVRLDRHCRRLFHFSFEIFTGALLGVLSQAAFYLYLADFGPWSQTLGTVTVAALVLAVMSWGLVSLVGAHRIRARLAHFGRAAGRKLGYWWVGLPPGSAARSRGPGTMVVFFLAFFALVFHNLNVVTTPDFRADRSIYSRARDQLVELHFRQGGIHGDQDSETRWFVDTAIRPKPAFSRLDLNHFVASVPVADLESGLHEIRASVRILQASRTEKTRAGLVLGSEPIVLRFLVVD